MEEQEENEMIFIIKSSSEEIACQESIMYVWIKILLEFTQKYTQASKMCMLDIRVTHILATLYIKWVEHSAICILQYACEVVLYMFESRRDILRYVNKFVNLNEWDNIEWMFALTDENLHFKFVYTF